MIRRVLIVLARALANPARLLRRALLHVPNLPVDVKLALDLYTRPHYAYGIAMAARQARALGMPAISCIEFGVGAGEGLLLMEGIAAEVEADTGVRVDVIGFDIGSGLPMPRDYRDLPYLYEGGYYAMDEAALRRRLRRAKLVIGPVAETVGVAVRDVAPIGFVAFDLDYFSSTMESFQIFARDAAECVPRVLCYFDDIANVDALQCEYTGEELAIREFNDRTTSAKIGKIRGLTWSRAIPAPWNDQMYACHFFDHPQYSTHIVHEAADYIQSLSATS